LRGLDENALYKVEAIDPGQLQEVGTLSGAYLMHHGINLDLHSDYDSTSVIFEKQP
jgi:alpha-galactosidase